MGIDNHKGKYIFFIDSDDYIHQDTIQILMDVAIKTNADIVECGVKYVDDDSQLKFGFGKQKQIDDNVLILKIQLKISIENDFNVELQAVGKFECDTSAIADDIKVWMLEKNAAAIMFPYIRSEITLLTAQPNCKPIIIPPININALFEKMRQDEANASN